MPKRMCKIPNKKKGMIQKIHKLFPFLKKIKVDWEKGHFSIVFCMPIAVFFHSAIIT